VVIPLVIGAAALERFCDTDVKRQLLRAGGGFARIYGPEGSALAEPLAETEEGSSTPTRTRDLVAIAKSAADPVGHYARPDMFRLLVNRNPAPAVLEAPPDEPVMAGFPSSLTSSEGRVVRARPDMTTPPGSMCSRACLAGAQVASRRKAHHGSSRTVFHEGSG
jgi:hypothetical protein